MHTFSCRDEKYICNKLNTWILWISLVRYDAIKWLKKKLNISEKCKLFMVHNFFTWLIVYADGKYVKQCVLKEIILEEPIN